MLIDENESITRAVASVFAHTLTLSRGEVLTYEAILRHGGFGREHISFGTFKQKLRRKVLKECGIAMRPIVNVGFRLLLISEQVVRCSYDRNKKIARQAWFGRKEISAVESDSLPLHLRQLKAIQENEFTSRRREARAACKKVTLAAGRTETNPRPAIISK